MKTRTSKKLLAIAFAAIAAILLVAGSVCANPGNLQTSGTHSLWFPFIDNTAAPSCNYFRSAITFDALYNDTTVFMDSNYNGVLEAGEVNETIDAGVATSFSSLPTGKAIKLTSNKPIQAYYYYASADYGAYDDNYYSYSAPIPGEKFVVPFDSVTVSVSAMQDATTVSFAKTTHHLNTGEVYSGTANAGTVITSDKPVCVVAVRNDKASQDNSHATELLPTSKYGTEFWAPGKLSLKYQGVESDNRMVHLTYADGRVEKRTLSAAPTKITTTAPAMAYYLFDVYAKDPWDGMRHYTSAHTVPPANTLGTEYIKVGAVISTHDGNTIQIDADYDGFFENTTILNAGEEYNAPQRHTGTHPGVYTEPIGHIVSTYPVFVRYVSIGNWGGTDEIAMARTVNWLDEYLPPTVSVTTDRFEYSPGDTMTTTIEIANPTADDLTFQWYWLVPQYSVCIPVTPIPVSIPAGYDETLEYSFAIPNWGATGFGNVFYVQLAEEAGAGGGGEVLDVSTAGWIYSPSREAGTEATPVEEANIANEIKKTVENIGL